MSGINEYANSDGYFFGVNEVVENYRSSIVAVFSDEGVSILEYHKSGRFRHVVLRRNIHVVSANGSREDLAAFSDMVSDCALWDALVANRILTQWIVSFDLRFLRPGERDGKCNDENSEKRVGFHCE